VFSGGDSFRPLVTSVLLGFVTVGITVLMGMAAAYAVARSSFARWGKKALEFVSTFPMAIPGTVVGINILLAFSAPHFFTGGVVLAGTGAALVLAYCTRTLPFVVQSSSAGFAAIPSDLEEAAATLGAGKLRTALSIFFPLLIPSLISGAVITFVTAFGEFPSSALLYTPLVRPASIEVLQQLRVYGLGSASALGVIMVAISSILLLYGKGRDVAPMG
ncbi:MAG TPA: ABC transporter permease subunit, partial [Candidatus Kapabacteria bacterium]|nr:ABC transporter permease subunit [Candidatus Kapabacteria bacterium]